jgi:hypothetical protein
MSDIEHLEDVERLKAKIERLEEALERALPYTINEGTRIINEALSATGNVPRDEALRIAGNPDPNDRS